MGCCSEVMEPIKASSCCTPRDTAADTARAMRDSGCGCAPVVDNKDTLELVGVITERDLCCNVVANQHTTSLPVVNNAGGCCGTVSAHATGKW